MASNDRTQDPKNDCFGKHFNVDMPAAVCLLLLEQGDRSLEDHVRDFLSLVCLTHYPVFSITPDLTSS